MLGRGGSEACRPDDLGEQFGLLAGCYHLSPVQAQAILDLKLHRLTGLEHEKIIADYKSLIELIAELLKILNSKVRLMEVVREELVEVQESFGDERRTEITNSSADLLIEDLIPEEEVVVTLSHEGYVKYQPLTSYEAQKRGGKGKAATKMKEEDYIAVFREENLLPRPHKILVNSRINHHIMMSSVTTLHAVSNQLRTVPYAEMIASSCSVVRELIMLDIIFY